jgi:hypothetical protein
MSKFVGQTTAQPRSRSTSSRHYSNSSYASHPGPSQTTTSRTFTSHSMTYSALPKPHEPPVNSVEYYQMQQLYGNPFTNIQQAAAPPHIQHTPTGALRDRYKSGSVSDEFSRPQPIQRQQQQQQPRQRQTSTDGGSTLSSLRNQYMNRAKETSQDELPAPQAYNISRTIVGEDIIDQNRPQQPPLQLQPAPQVLQKQPQAPQQQPAPAQQASEQEQVQDENVDQQASSSEVAPPSADDTPTNEPPSSSY